MGIEPEVIGYLAAFCTTISFLPQAYLTLKTRDTESLSLGMYSTFTLGVLLWLLYGLLIEDKVIVLANVITFVLSATILVFKIYHTLTRAK
ncbi:MAG: SemiSWEET transporter [Methylococcales bacterium]|jgi:MtN3 and saliva related transmembrane protein|nr:glutathione synthetase [Methylococcaceae bacterium]HIL41036.1 glutathione synthetase [Methylococcales bacterium]